MMSNFDAFPRKFQILPRHVDTSSECRSKKLCCFRENNLKIVIFQKPSVNFDTNTYNLSKTGFIYA